MLLDLLHVLGLAGFPPPPPPIMIAYYCLFCSALVQFVGQFVFNKWKGLFSVPFLYPIPVVILSVLPLELKKNTKSNYFKRSLTYFLVHIMPERLCHHFDSQH